MALSIKFRRFSCTANQMHRQRTIEQFVIPATQRRLACAYNDRISLERLWLPIHTNMQTCVINFQILQSLKNFNITARKRNPMCPASILHKPRPMEPATGQTNNPSPPEQPSQTSHRLACRAAAIQHLSGHGRPKHSETSLKH